MRLKHFFSAYTVGNDNLQWLAEKLAVSISAIRKVARILLFVKIQNILIKDVLKT